MKIVLLERVSKLGQMGDIVDVKSGYARNFLLPNKIGLRATEANIQIFEGKKAELETKNLESKAAAKKVKVKLEGKYFILLRSASDAGALYGSVSSKDICKAAASEEVKISKNQVILEKPIKTLTLQHTLSIRSLGLPPEPACLEESRDHSATDDMPNPTGTPRLLLWHLHLDDITEPALSHSKSDP